MYSCDKCGKSTDVIYASRDKSAWLCEKCWEKEDAEYASIVRASMRKLKVLKQRAMERYRTLNSLEGLIK